MYIDSDLVVSIYKCIQMFYNTILAKLTHTLYTNLSVDGDPRCVVLSRFEGPGLLLVAHLEAKHKANVQVNSFHNKKEIPINSL